MDDDTSCPVEAAVGAYLGYLKRRGHPEKTVTKYRHYLNMFGEWAGARGLDISAREIELDYLAAWHDSYLETRGKAPSESTIRNHIQALRSFYKFAERFDYLTGPNPMNRIDPPKAERRKGVKSWLRPDELENLMASCQNPREAIVIWFLSMTGVRWGEAQALRQRDVNVATGMIEITDSKTANGLRTIPLIPELRPVILRWFNYLEGRGLRDPNLPFFVTRNQTAMVEQQAIVLTKRVAARAGVQPVSPHTLRRTFGSSLINQGLRLEVVSKLLGHGSTTVTEQSYAELLNATIVEEVLRAVA